jgi:hypothetical protein
MVVLHTLKLTTIVISTSLMFEMFKQLVFQILIISHIDPHMIGRVVIKERFNNKWAIKFHLKCHKKIEINNKTSSIKVSYEATSSTLLV